MTQPDTSIQSILKGIKDINAIHTELQTILGDLKDDDIADLLKRQKLLIKYVYSAVTVNSSLTTKKTVKNKELREKLAKIKKPQPAEKTLIPENILEILLHWNSKKSLPNTRLSSMKGTYYVENQSGTCKRSIRALRRIMKGTFFRLKKDIEYKNSIDIVFIKRSIDRYADFKKKSKRNRIPLEQFLYNKLSTAKKNYLLHRSPLIYFLNNDADKALDSIQPRKTLDTKIEKVMFNILCSLIKYNEKQIEIMATSDYNHIVSMAKKAAVHIKSTYRVPKGRDSEKYLLINAIPDCKRIMQQEFEHKGTHKIKSLWVAVNALEWKLTNSSAFYSKNTARAQMI